MCAHTAQVDVIFPASLLVLELVSGFLLLVDLFVADQSSLTLKPWRPVSANVAQVDVIFPASPLFLWLNPRLLWQLIVPHLEYANNATAIAYNLPWAPHHLGTFPIADVRPEWQVWAL